MSVYRSRFVVILAAVGVLGAACQPVSEARVTACVSKTNGATRIVEPSQRCWVGEHRTSWAVEGPQGTPGDRGPAGPAGAAGRDGAAGTAGLSMRSGVGTPGAELGAVGEFYLDADARLLYGPKSASGWPAPVSLRGDAGSAGVDGADGSDGADGVDGVDGSDGNRIHLGSGAPAGDLGVDGDLHLDVDTFDLRGRNEGAWSLAGNLTGPSGPIGPQGPAGADGRDGVDGRDGRDGVDGVDGVDGSRITRGEGPPAAPGADGDLHLDVTTFELWSHDGTGWFSLGSLRGDPGETGPAGPPGPAGPTQCTLGEVTLQAGPRRPAGTLVAAGQTLPINPNAALYAVIGFAYGGNGSTTFALPDLRTQAPTGHTYVICVDGQWPALP